MQDRTGEDLRRYGLAGVLLRLWNERRSSRKADERHMELLETLPLGSKRQLMLIRCAGDRFLVGGSLDCIETIVKIGPSNEGFAHQDGCA